MFSLYHSVKTSAITSEFHLRILTGKSRFGIVFLLLMLLISPLTSSAKQHLNENTFAYLKELFIRKIPGLFLYVLIAFTTGSDSSITSVSKLSSFSIFNILTALMKNLLKVSETFDSSLKTSPFSTRVNLDFVE